MQLFNQFKAKNCVAEATCVINIICTGKHTIFAIEVPNMTQQEQNCFEVTCANKDATKYLLVNAKSRLTQFKGV